LGGEVIQIQGRQFGYIDLGNAYDMAGVIYGSMLPFLIAALTMRLVQKVTYFVL